jgi:hypothetical protein
MARRTAWIVAIGLLAGACATAPPLAPPTGLVPDLRGTWSGTWGEAAVTLLLLDQDTAGDGGVYVGPWQVLGQPLPGVTGVLTYTAGGQALSRNVQGRLGDSGGRLTLVLEPGSVHGQTLVLSLVGADRLQGSGTSRLSWEPRGPVDLRRQPPS